MVGKFGNRSGYMRGLFSDGVDKDQDLLYGLYHPQYNPSASFRRRSSRRHAPDRSAAELVSKRDLQGRIVECEAGRLEPHRHHSLAREQ